MPCARMDRYLESFSRCRLTCAFVYFFSCRWWFIGNGVEKADEKATMLPASVAGVENFKIRFFSAWLRV